MKKKIFLSHSPLFYIILITYSLTLFSCKRKVSIEDSPCPICPYISYVHPDTASAGDTIRLSGINFSPTLEENKVTLNDSICPLVDSPHSEILLYIVLPPKCSTGKIRIMKNNNELLTNYDNWVLKENGPEPTIYIK